MGAVLNNSVREEIYFRTDRDLVDDSTVIGKEESTGNWIIKGNFVSSYQPNDPNDPVIREYQPMDGEFLQDVRWPSSPSIEDIERKMFWRDFQVKDAANKGMREISLVLTDSGGGFEILHLWPSTTTPITVKKIMLQLESNSASANGKAAALETAPFLLEGRTMVPLRFIAEALGVTTTWNAETQRVTLKTANDQIVLGIDRKEAIVNGKSTVLDAPATIKGGVMMVPVRFVSESLRMNVFFSDGSILITDLADPGYPYTQTGKP